MKRLRRELAAVCGPTWRAVRERGIFAMDVALILSLGTVVFWIGYNSGAAHWFRAVSAVHETDVPAGLRLLRIPLSVLAPYPGVPVVLMVLMIMISLTVGQVHLGRLRMLAIGLAGQYLATLGGWLITGTAVATWLGLGPGDSSDLDTGPSVVCVSVLIAVFVVRRCPLLGVLLTAGLVGELVVLHSLTGVEHLLAVLVGAVAGLVVRRDPEPVVA